MAVFGTSQLKHFNSTIVKNFLILDPNFLFEKINLIPHYDPKA
jgi:hypothetical protein